MRVRLSRLGLLTLEHCFDCRFHVTLFHLVDFGAVVHRAHVSDFALASQDEKLRRIRGAVVTRDRLRLVVQVDEREFPFLSLLSHRVQPVLRDRVHVHRHQRHLVRVLVGERNDAILVLKRARTTVACVDDDHDLLVRKIGERVFLALRSRQVLPHGCGVTEVELLVELARRADGWQEKHEAEGAHWEFTTTARKGTEKTVAKVRSMSSMQRGANKNLSGWSIGPGKQRSPLYPLCTTSIAR